jgi:drug/metabolite transporter (DMT)-like permease
LSLAAVYLIWGASFAVTKFMVGGLPALLAGSARFLGASALLLALALHRGERIPTQRREWRHFLVMGVSQVVLSAGINALALKHLPSNQSALLNASGALWIAILGSLGSKGHPLTRQVSVGVALGFLGVALLVWPHDGFSFADFSWQLIVLGACLSWGIGTIYCRRTRIETPMLMFTALNMFVGGLVLLSAGTLAGELPQWQWHWPNMLALLYLMVFNSGLGYTSYNYLTRHTSPALVSTYAYVNPAVAAVVAWLALGEKLTAHQLGGMAIILMGVVLVSLGEVSSPRRTITRETRR